MTNPRITVITPSYNQGAFIEETICSILGQQYDNLEYIVIDGGSNDGSPETIRKYESKLTYWISEKDRGQTHAINKGLQRATGDILVWINSDDMLEPEALSRVARYFTNHPDVDVVHGQTILFGGVSQLIRGADPANLPFQYLSGMAFPQPSAFIRRSAMLAHYPMMDESLHYGMDFDLFSCLFLNGNFLSVPDVFSRYRLHPASKTVLTHERFAVDWQKVFCKVVASLGGNAKIENGLRELGMWMDSPDRYPTTKKLSEDFLMASFQHFLVFQINFYYRDLNVRRVKAIASFIQRNFPITYEKQHLRRLHLASRVPFARYLIPLVRKSSF